MSTTINRKCGGGSVLVVDDDDTVRLLSSTALADAGYTVRTARDGIEALELMAAGGVDCIVTDVQMPRMDGFELCARVRAMPGSERIQLLVMTGSDDYEAIERAYDVGANDFFLKHSNPAMLIERVRFVFRAQHMQDALRVSEQRLLYAQRLAVLGHWERTLNGRTVAVSPVISNLLGIDEQQQLDWDLLCELSDPDDIESMKRILTRAIAQRATFRLEHRVCTRGGKSLVLLHHGEVVAGPAGDWVIRSTVQDVTEARAQEERIRFLAFHDPLTALPNRESATRSLAAIIATSASAGEHAAVFALWLDDFSRIAGSLGQSVSDAVLKTIGQRLRNALRGSDQVLHADARDAGGANVVARMDGDKFLCLVGYLQQGETAIGIAQRLQRAVSSPLQMGDTELALSASVGISVYPEDGQTEDELIERAFQALAHTAGQKGACQFFASEISRRARSRLNLEAELRRAIDANEFELHYQPRMCLGDRGVRGAEALIRWRHPERGMIMPGQFISLAEEAGLIVPLGRLVIDMVAQRAAIWRRAISQDFRISFNISPLQFGVADLVGDIDRAVQRERAWHDNLEAEITESALMSRHDQVAGVLGELRERGLRLALDDFGTGFSSLSYLRQLPLDVLKIDRSFVADIGVSPSGSSLVNAILYMSHALGMTCIAEGVEHESQLEFLAANHCGEMQGFLLARPMPAEDFEHWLLRWQGELAMQKRSSIA